MSIFDVADIIEHSQKSEGGMLPFARREVNGNGEGSWNSEIEFQIRAKQIRFKLSINDF